MSPTYIIHAPAYTKNSGGVCALHYLADRLIHYGAQEVYLTTDVLNPRWKSKTINVEHPFFLGKMSSDWLYQLIVLIKPYIVFNIVKRPLVKLQNRLFIKMLWNHFDINKTIVICPEVLDGTPFDAKHIVRWILNTPGACGGNGVFRSSDHIFLYHPFFSVDSSYSVKGLLTVIDLDYQLKTYQNYDRPDRQGGAYLIRKGHLKRHDQHPRDFVYADPILEKMTDQEAASFFNNLKTFVSYDDMTWISVQAALCGCKSIVIEGVGSRSSDNLKKINRILGVAYGWNDEEWRLSTLPNLRVHLESQNHTYLQTIPAFMQYCNSQILNLSLRP